MADIKVLPGAGELNIKSKGVQVYEYHQVEKADARQNHVQKEPIMHAINKDWGWKLHKFANYSNVGVEDLTFKGHAKEKFIHHGSDVDDGGFKLIDFVPAYPFMDTSCKFRKRQRGYVYHQLCQLLGIRYTDRRKSRAFVHPLISLIARLYRESGGKQRRIYIKKGSRESTLIEYKNNVGQYHACSVSKQSMGA